ncbi:MAG: glycosyltransferase involved in cell wall biosynthesis [Crocinitomicaceae bacterium]|jgi:glycosyltransferase involved in cell wall biosynthesis
MTDPLGQSQVLPYISGLTKKGYEFHLISFEKMDRYLHHKRHIRKICEDNGIHWHPQDYHSKGGLFKTIKQVRRMRKIARYLHSQHNFSIVHCRSYISALVGLNMKRSFGTKFVFDMRGFWADERVDGKIWDLKNPLFKRIYTYFKRKEIQFFTKSDYTISLTENGKEEILSWKSLAANPPKIKVIPCCVNLDLFDPSKIKKSDQVALKDKLGISSETYVLGYIGSIGTWYMLAEMLDYFKCLHASNPTAIFLFVTAENSEMIHSVASEKGIDPSSLIITSSLHQGVPLHISIFDHSIFFIRASYSKKASSPTKQAEIMAMGIPLVCNSGVGDTDHIVRKYASGIVIDTFDEVSYNASLVDTNFDAEHVMKGAKDYFSLEQGIERYLQVYKEVDG